MRKPYIRCNPKSKRHRDMLAAQLGVDKEEAMDIAMQYAWQNKENIRRRHDQMRSRDPRHKSKRRKNPFEGGWLG